MSEQGSLLRRRLETWGVSVRCKAMRRWRWQRVCLRVASFNNNHATLNYATLNDLLAA